MTRKNQKVRIKKCFADKIRTLSAETFVSDKVGIKIIEDEDDLWYAVMECKITPEQEAFVNPAGFSIGRAYLNPENNVPCVIYKNGGERVGYIVLRTWLGEGEGYSWSFYVDKDHQGQGLGKAAAQLAVKILKAADSGMPIKLSAEADNVKAQRLYESIGFVKSDELDGDDLVFTVKVPYGG